MSGQGLATLRRLVAERYDALRRQVARRLGGASDLAGDALHDAYLRLSARDDLDAVRHPQTYLVNTAVHVAIDRIRQDVRLLSESEVGEFFDVEDSVPGPESVAAVSYTHQMCIRDRPSTREDSMNSFSRSDSTVPRTMRVTDGV